MSDRKITQTPLKSRLFKFKSHPHGVFGVWHLLKSHYEKWVQKSPEALRHLGFFGWHPLRMHNMVAGEGLEPLDLRVMSPTSYQLLYPAIYRIWCGAGDRSRTGTILSYHGILSPGRLPIPPHRQILHRMLCAGDLHIISQVFSFVNRFFKNKLNNFSA